MAQLQYVDIAGNMVRVFFNGRTDVSQIIQSKNFSLWVKKIEKKFQLREIHITSIDVWGGRMGFIKLNVDIIDRKGNTYNRVAFLRGNSVACLTVLSCEGRDYGVFVRQPRIAMGVCRYLEMPAGMMDEDSDPAYVMAKEISEELKYEVVTISLTDVTVLDLGPGAQGYALSPGLLDEHIYIFVYYKKVTREELNSFIGRQTGAEDENEDIVTDVIALDDVEKMKEVKKVAATRVALSLYREYKNQIKVDLGGD